METERQKKLLINSVLSHPLSLGLPQSFFSTNNLKSLTNRIKSDQNKTDDTISFDYRSRDYFLMIFLIFATTFILTILCVTSIGFLKRKASKLIILSPDYDSNSLPISENQDDNYQEFFITTQRSCPTSLVPSNSAMAVAAATAAAVASSSSTTAPSTISLTFNGNSNEIVRDPESLSLYLPSYEEAIGNCLFIFFFLFNFLNLNSFFEAQSNGTTIGTNEYFVKKDGEHEIPPIRPPPYTPILTADNISTITTSQSNDTFLTSHIVNGLITSRNNSINNNDNNESLIVRALLYPLNNNTETNSNRSAKSGTNRATNRSHNSHNRIPMNCHKQRRSVTSSNNSSRPSSSSSASQKITTNRTSSSTSRPTTSTLSNIINSQRNCGTISNDNQNENEQLQQTTCQIDDNQPSTSIDAQKKEDY
jgi:hypothetical protein